MEKGGQVESGGLLSMVTDSQYAVQSIRDKKVNVSAIDRHFKGCCGVPAKSPLLQDPASRETMDWIELPM